MDFVPLFNPQAYLHSSDPNFTVILFIIHFGEEGRGDYTSLKYEHSIEQYLTQNAQLLIQIYYYFYLVMIITMTTTIDDSTKQKYIFIKKNHTDHQISPEELWMKCPHWITTILLAYDF